MAVHEIRPGDTAIAVVGLTIADLENGTGSFFIASGETFSYAAGKAMYPVCLAAAPQINRRYRDLVIQSINPDWNIAKPQEPTGADIALFSKDGIHGVTYIKPSGGCDTKVF